MICKIKKARYAVTAIQNGKPWWRHQIEQFSALLALCAGNSPVPVNSPHKGQWRGALMFSFICAWINDWVNNREAGDLRRHRGHYDVNVMRWTPLANNWPMTVKAFPYPDVTMYRWKAVRICLPTSIYTAFAIYFNAIIPAHGTLDEHCKHFQGNVAIKKRS